LASTGTSITGLLAGQKAPATATLLFARACYNEAGGRVWPATVFARERQIAALHSAADAQQTD